jgi:hypothetical protein
MKQLHHFGLCQVHLFSPLLGALDILLILVRTLSKVFAQFSLFLFYFHLHYFQDVFLTFCSQGYNIKNFDIKYILERATVLGIAGEFCYLSKIKGEETKAKKSHFESKAYGKKESFDYKYFPC